MARQGFEYVPHVVIGTHANPTGLPTDLPAAEFRRRYGYGISTGFESALQLEPATPAVDPNIAIVAALPAAKRARYRAALSGDATDDDSPQGCQLEASRVADPAEAVMAEFGAELNRLWASVDTDSRVVRAQESWSACMTRAGYRYPDPTAIQNEIARRMNPLYRAVTGQEVAEGEARLVRGAVLAPDQRRLLATVQAFELAVANADQDCRGELDRIRTAVQQEYEARFVAQHRDRLQALLPGRL